MFSTQPDPGDDRRTAKNTTERQIKTPLLYHVVSNDIKKDCGAVASILDAIIARLKKKLPSVKCLYLFSDNELCYQNGILPLFETFIACNNGFILVGFV